MRIHEKIAKVVHQTDLEMSDKFSFQARKEDAEKKRLEALEKKKEREQLLAEEDAQHKAQAAKKGGQTNKMTRAQIREDTEKREAIARGNKVTDEVKTHLDAPLEENINRVQVEGVEARNVDEALSALRYEIISKIRCM